MLRSTDTTVFNVDAQTIVNTVNCVGVMGAGLALEFQLRFPEMEKDYVERCKAKKVEVGRPYLYKEYGDPWILNFPTKNHWKYPSKIEWIEQGLKYFSLNYQRGGITSIAFPKLGCSNGGLEWDVVSPLMEKYLQNLDIDVFICEDSEREASGTERFMVQMLNEIESLSWAIELDIRSAIRKKIVSALPIHRFRDLRKVEGIGKQTYNDVFSFLYTLANRGRKENLIRSGKTENLSLFEENSSQGTELTIQSHQAPEVESEDPNSSARQNQKSDVVLHNLQYEEQDKDPSLKEISVHDEENQDGINEYDAFYIMLPYFEKALSTEHTKDEIVSKFKLPKKLVGDWLEEAEKLGRVRKLSCRPTKYIAVSSLSNEQLECSFDL
jgi:O-acetyl-ADP-ribose deacetylase (regulator of RNase III)